MPYPWLNGQGMGTTHGYKSMLIPYPCGYGTRRYPYPWVKIAILSLDPTAELVVINWKWCAVSQQAHVFIFFRNRDCLGPFLISSVSTIYLSDFWWLWCVWAVVQQSTSSGVCGGARIYLSESKRCMFVCCGCCLDFLFERSGSV
jgi:hypothetical protein